ncbi:MAG: ATP synthase F0 subunit C [Planctomycetaceae bacterium]|nr:ATP synthase F0 subunit C [Planctomycetaceae bacterium]
MNKFVKTALIAFAFAVIFAPVAVFAQEGETASAAAATVPLLKNLISIGAALIVIGAGYGIGRIGSSAVESMARQPEVAGSIQGAMILSAALIEGAAMFGLIICLLGYFV